MMTTLRFGDVTPKTFVGKILTKFCALFGLLMLSLLTGTFISVVTETGNLSIKENIVVVKNLTMEQLVVEQKYNARTIVKQSYREVIEHIGNAKDTDTLAAVMDFYVARFLVDLAEKNFH